jgi:hypothetical protein
MHLMTTAYFIQAFNMANLCFIASISQTPEERPIATICPANSETSTRATNTVERRKYRRKRKRLRLPSAVLSNRV